MNKFKTLNGQKKLRHQRIWKRVFIALLIMALALIGGLLVLRYISYEHINIVEVYENESTSNGHYEEYVNGVIEYSKDGIAYLKQDGSEIWNHPCQMGSPFAVICQEAVAIADKGGTNILVFQKEGLKGEIKTTRPIEKATVSAQGIVAALLKDDEVPQIICYDAKGNVLVELKATFLGTGYPVDIALSQDGTELIVSYLGIKGTGTESRVVYYNFGEAGANADEHKVAEMNFPNTVVPITAFLDKNHSLLVSDQSFMVMKGLENPEKICEVSLDKEIRKLAYNEEMIAFLLKNQEGNELRIYDLNGQVLFSREIADEYVEMKISDGQIFLVNGSKCAIYNELGTCKYVGNTEMQILDIFPTMGVEKYIVISTDGFQKIQLVK